MLDGAVIRAIADWRPRDVVTSLYLDVDGRRYPRRSDVDRRLEHLLRTARQDAQRDAQWASAAVEAELAEIARWLGGDLDRETTRGVALFAGGAEGRFESLALAVPVHDQVVVDRGPDVAQLCEVLVTSPSALVVAVDRQRWRVVRCDPGRVEELDVLDDQLPRWVDTDVELGGFDRHHEELAREHYRRVARRVAEELGPRSSRYVVLSGPEASTARLESYLPGWVVSRVADRLGLPVDSPADRLAESGREAVERAERRRRAAVVDTLRQRAATGTAAVTGLGDTLEALEGGEVDTLVVEVELGAPGRRCGECGFLTGEEGRLTAEEGRCPRCGARLWPVQNVVDAAVTDAFLHDVTLEPVEEGSLADLGHIGALVARWAARAHEGGSSA